VPRNTKTAENKNQTSSEPGAPAPRKKTGKRQSGRRAATTKKPRKSTSAKDTIAETTAQISAFPQPQPATSSSNLSEDNIRLRAYFISERRRRFALPGDAESDWLEAKRQLFAEARR
jgi:hypothetical protein